MRIHENENPGGETAARPDAVYGTPPYEKLPEVPRILLVEDLPADAELNERELRRGGISFVSRRVETKEAFIAALTDFEPDVILSDYGLPQFNGVEALRLINERGLDTPLILVTGSLTEEVAVECMKEGASDYILKSSLKRLPSAVLNALERRQARRSREETIAALRRSEERYRNVVENIKEVIFQTDAAGRWAFLNPAWTEITRFTIDESIGRTLLDFVHTDDRDLIAGEFQALIARVKDHYRHEVRFLKKNGGLCWIEVHARLTLNASGEPIGCSGSLNDITERRHAEESLRDSEEKLRQSQKLEAVGQLAGGVAHDFNNLLTAIVGYSDLTLRRLDQADPLRRNIEEIQKAGARATALTRQLLAFSRKQILQPRVLDLNAIVADMDKMLRRLIGEDVDIFTALDGDLGHVKADSGQIEQIIMNLAVNSRDSMPEGGKLTIKTANMEVAENYSEQHTATRPGRYVMLAVSDTGCGMDLETQSHIFEPFFTTKEQGRGTGLGLSTVYGIVTQSGGNIWVYSEIGCGTTFKIYLPRVDEQPVSVQAEVSHKKAVRASETILLVEDEGGVRKLLREIFEAEGYRILETDSGSVALEYCRHYEGEIHLMLTDVIMPGLSGREIAKRAASLRPEMKVIFMSGYTDDAIIHHGVLDPGMEFVEKPFNPDAVVRKVRDVLGASLCGKAEDTEHVKV